MKLISRILSLVICLQLSVSCNNELKINNLGSSDGSKLKISGTIAKAIHTVSDLVFPQAMADGGTLTFYNVDDPNSPVEVYSAEIASDSYSVEVDKSLVQDHLIQISFTSNDDSSLDRMQVLQVSNQDSEVDGSLDSDTELNAKIVLAQLKYELLHDQIQTEDIKQRFSEIHEISFDDQAALVGLSLIKAMVKDPALSEEALLVLVNHRRTIEALSLMLDENGDPITVADLTYTSYPCSGGPMARCMSPQMQMENRLDYLADLVLSPEISNFEEASGSQMSSSLNSLSLELMSL